MDKGEKVQARVRTGTSAISDVCSHPLRHGMECWSAEFLERQVRAECQESELGYLYTHYYNIHSTCNIQFFAASTASINLFVLPPPSITPGGSVDGRSLHIIPLPASSNLLGASLISGNLSGSSPTLAAAKMCSRLSRSKASKSFDAGAVCSKFHSVHVARIMERMYTSVGAMRRITVMVIPFWDQPRVVSASRPRMGYCASRGKEEGARYIWSLVAVRKEVWLSIAKLCKIYTRVGSAAAIK